MYFTCSIFYVISRWIVLLLCYYYHQRMSQHVADKQFVLALSSSVYVGSRVRKRLVLKLVYFYFFTCWLGMMHFLLFNILNTRSWKRASVKSCAPEVERSSVYTFFIYFLGPWNWCTNLNFNLEKQVKPNEPGH